MGNKKPYNCPLEFYRVCHIRKFVLLKEVLRAIRSNPCKGMREGNSYARITPVRVRCGALEHFTDECHAIMLGRIPQ